MLSDRDRETLNEIQSQLATEDPRFTGSFDVSARRLTTRGPRSRQTVLTALLVVTLVLSALMIMVHAAGPAVFFATAAACLIWLRWGPRAGDRQ